MPIAGRYPSCRGLKSKGFCMQNFIRFQCASALLICYSARGIRLVSTRWVAKIGFAFYSKTQSNAPCSFLLY